MKTKDRIFFFRLDMRVTVIVLLFCVFYFNTSLFAQLSDTIDLREVAVSPRYTQAIAQQNKRRTDTVFLQVFQSASIAQLLQNENAVFIKAYGPSGSAASAIRGGNSAQTAVMWNGFNIRNPMLGETDLSLLSVFFVDDVSVQLGGSTAVWGNASVAGTIHLQNKPEFNRGLQASLFFSSGSFDNRTTGLKLSFGNRHWYCNTRMVYKTVVNDFDFTLPGGERKKMQHAALHQGGILQEHYFLVKKDQVLTVRMLMQRYDREIPPADFNSLFHATQQDEIIRSTAEWTRQQKKIKTLVRQAFFVDRIWFTDGLTKGISFSQASTSISEGEWLWQQVPSVRWQWGINNTYCVASANAYDRKVCQNFLSFFGSFSYKSPLAKQSLQVSARTEHTRNKIQPFTFSLEYQRGLFSFLSVRSTVNKLYRLPNLNDLYWNPGGNPNLLPEKGYSEDISLLFHREKRSDLQRKQVEISAGFFSRQMENWIIWLPGSNGYWTPQNLLHVWSRGTETNSAILYNRKKSSIRFHINTQYILSTNQRSRSVSDQSAGKQLIYTPMYSGSAGLQFSFRSVYFSFVNTYTGFRYTSSDNVYYLPPYVISNAVIGCKITRGSCRTDLNFSANNLFDTNYEVVANRPMPGRNFLLNVNFSFHQQPKT